MEQEIEYLTSKEVRKELKIRSCDLMHLRQDGTLKAKKKGNAYLYEKQSVSQIKGKE